MVVEFPRRWGMKVPLLLLTVSMLTHCTKKESGSESPPPQDKPSPVSPETGPSLSQAQLQEWPWRLHEQRNFYENENIRCRDAAYKVINPDQSVEAGLAKPNATMQWSPEIPDPGSGFQAMISPTYAAGVWVRVKTYPLSGEIVVERILAKTIERYSFDEGCNPVVEVIQNQQVDSNDFVEKSKYQINDTRVELLLTGPAAGDDWGTIEDKDVDTSKGYIPGYRNLSGAVVYVWCPGMDYSYAPRNVDSPDAHGMANIITAVNEHNEDLEDDRKLNLYIFVCPQAAEDDVKAAIDVMKNNEVIGDYLSAAQGPLFGNRYSMEARASALEFYMRGANLHWPSMLVMKNSIMDRFAFVGTTDVPNYRQQIEKRLARLDKDFEYLRPSHPDWYEAVGQYIDTVLNAQGGANP